MAETIEELKKKLALYETDATKKGFYALNRIVNLQVEQLNKFELDTEIGQNPKDDKKYDRVKALWEGLRSMISDLNALKIELKITGNEKEDTSNSVAHSFLDGNA